MNSNRKKILVTLDGSVHFFDAVNYLGRTLPPESKALVLFNVYARNPAQ